MQDPTVDMYAYLVNFVGQSALVRPKLAQLPSQYAEYADVASEDNAKALTEHLSYDLAINLAPETQLPYLPLYNLSIIELEVLQTYLTNYIARG
jgi:hypothetical protein